MFLIGLDMLNAPQVAMSELQYQDIVSSKQGKSKRKGLKSILMPKQENGGIMNNNEDVAERDSRIFIPTPISTSTDAFTFNTGLGPLSPKMTLSQTETLPDQLPTNGDAWRH